MNLERGERGAAGRVPWFTLGIVAAALLVALLPGIEKALEYDRAAVGKGQVWRLLTGQLVHWTPRMMLADVTVLLVLGAWLESRSRRLALSTLLAGALLVGAGLHWFAPALSHYRGSSGLASALLVAASLDLAAGSSRLRVRLAALAALTLFGVKLLWEMETGRALAAGPLLPGVAVTPWAHVMGGAAGLVAYLLHRLQDRVRERSGETHTRPGVPSGACVGPGTQALSCDSTS